MSYRPQTADDPLWPPDGPSEAPGTRQEGSWGVSEADRAWAAEASERGAFLPTLKVPGLARPTSSKRRGRWGKTSSNPTAAGNPPVDPK